VAGDEDFMLLGDEEGETHRNRGAAAGS